MQLSEPIPVRFPADTLRQIRKESAKTFIPVASLIRAAVVEKYPPATE